jgi:hypothetical protein
VACCKPKIRKNADVNEWIVGTGSKHNVGQDKLIYAMKIVEEFLEWIENNYKTGIHGDPHDFEQKLNGIKKSC